MTTTTTAMPTPAATIPATMPTPAATISAAVERPVSSPAAAKSPAATGMAGKAWNRAGWIVLIAGGIIGLGMFGFLAWHGSITQGQSNPPPIVNTGPAGVESNMVGGSTT